MSPLFVLKQLNVEVNTIDLINGNVESVKVNEENWDSESDVYKTEDGQNTIQVVVKADDGYQIGMRKGGDSLASISDPFVEGDTYTFTVTYDNQKASSTQTDDSTSLLTIGLLMMSSLYLMKRYKEN